MQMTYSHFKAMKVVTNGCTCQHHTYTDKTGLPFKSKSKRHAPARKGKQEEGALICSHVSEESEHSLGGKKRSVCSC